MAQKPELQEDVMALLAEGKTPAEIKEETGCSAATVSIAKKKMAAAIRDEEANEADEADNRTVSDFVKRIKLTPDPDTLNKDKKKATVFSFECGGCGHAWETDVADQVSECPACGCEF